MGEERRRRSVAACPRCGRTVREPTAWSSAWRCDLHGEIHPLLPAFSPSREGLDGLPWPLPVGWLVTFNFAVIDVNQDSRPGVFSIG